MVSLYDGEVDGQESLRIATKKVKGRSRYLQNKYSEESTATLDACC